MPARAGARVVRKPADIGQPIDTGNPADSGQPVKKLVTVVVGFKRTLGPETKILLLLIRKLRQLHADFLEV